MISLDSTCVTPSCTKASTNPLEWMVYHKDLPLAHYLNQLITYSDGGLKGGSGNVSSRYTMMSLDSICVTPSCTKASTNPLEWMVYHKDLPLAHYLNQLITYSDGGLKGGSGNVSSRYTMMSLDSICVTPSCTKAGTIPLGWTV